MRIGILTHPLRTNCGGILQNYALQTIIRQMGHDVETIDRHNDITFCYRILSWCSRIFRKYILRHKVSTDFYLVKTRKQFLKEDEKFVTFIKKYIKLSPYIKCNKDLVKINNFHYDVVVVGSDQVWLNLYLPWSFLEFADKNIRRISYAASFGRSELNYTKSQLECAKQGLRLFYAISVREDSGIDICKEKFNVDATHVLDPTMLLDMEDYIKLCKDVPPISTKPFLLSYILDNNEDKKKYVNKVAEVYGLKVVNYYDIETISVERWISLFRDCSYVITDSFHGTVFSIIFNKQFVSISNFSRGNARFDSLLKMYNLKSRLADESRLEAFDINIQNNVDYSKVNCIREELKQKSLLFLENALS